MSIHIFDVDHTITRHSTSIQFLFQGIRMGVLPFFPVLSIPAVYARYRLGRLSMHRVDRNVPGLRGTTQEDLRRVADACFHERIRRDLFGDAVSFIRSITESGGEIILATLSVDLVVEPLAELLSARHVIASTLEFRQGLCTGRFAGDPVFSEEKRDQVLGYLASSGVHPGDCTFYSDSVHDLPLLEAVGRPVAVNPDRRLSAHAAHRGWQILCWG